MASLMRRLRKAWNDYLKKLTKANRDAFGGGRGDCCGPKKAAGKKTRF